MKARTIRLDIVHLAGSAQKVGGDFIAVRQGS